MITASELAIAIAVVKVASEPEALLAVLKNPAYHFKRIGVGSRVAVVMVIQRSR